MCRSGSLSNVRIALVSSLFRAMKEGRLEDYGLEGSRMYRSETLVAIVPGSSSWESADHIGQAVISSQWGGGE